MCELDVSHFIDVPAHTCVPIQIMFNLEKAHFLLDEIVSNGCIVQTDKSSVLHTLNLMEKKATLATS